MYFMLFSRKDLTKIIFPLFIEQLLVITIGMADSMMVAGAGEAAVSGVSLVDTVNILLSYIFSALATGGAVVSAQFIGKKDYDSARASAKQLIYSVLFVSIIIMGFALVCRTSMLNLVFGSIDSDVMFSAKNYFLYSALSYPFLALYNAAGALFRSMGNSKVSMIASFIMNIVNIIGNAILIYGFKTGVAGAAIATLISRVVGAAFLIILLHDKHNIIYVEKIFKYRPDFTIIKSILNIGVPSGIENGMFQFGKVLTQSLVSTFGTYAIVANAVASTISSFEYAIGTAIGLAMITVIGRCVGAEDYEQAKYYAKKLLKIEYIALVSICILITVLLKPITIIYNLSPDSAKMVYLLMILHHIFISTIWPFSFTIPNSFRAANDVKYPLAISLISMWIFRIAFSYILGLWFNLGVLGVWLAMFIDWAFRFIVFAIRYTRGTWLTKYKTIKTV